MIAKMAVRYANEARRVKQAYDKGLKKSLDRAGTITRRNAQRQFSSRKKKTRPEFHRVGVRDGTPMVSASFRPSIAGKITSWKTSRNANGFLRSAIRYAKDMKRETVVIGPTDAAVHVNQLQEFGGSAGQEFRLISQTPLSEFQGRRVGSLGVGERDARGRFGAFEALIGVWVDRRSKRRGPAVRRRSVKVPAGRFMGKGLEKTIPVLPQQFKGLVQGP
jgi:hypothetical protein